MNKFILLFFVFMSSAIAYEKSDAFIVEANPESYKVLSPTKVEKKISVIIKNKMYSTLRAKLISDRIGDIKTITIKQDDNVSVEFTYSRADKFYVVPISPPFQRVQLKLGQKSYEIPEKK